MANKSRWLYPYEAELLGLEIKDNEPARKNARYSISDELWEVIKRNRETQKEREFVETIRKLDKNGNILTTTEKLQSEPIEVPENFELIKVSTSKTTGQQWLQHAPKKEKEQDYISSIHALVEELKKNVEPEKPVKRPLGVNNQELCNQYTLTDYHLGMMSWAEETGSDWDMKIAEETLVSFFKIAMERSPKADNAIFAQIGDFLHWDGLDAVTPQSKHILDADTRFTKLVRVAIRVIRRVIKMLLQKYQNVTVIMAEGNHDMASSVWLREVLHSFYEDEPRLTIDTNPDPYYCIVWGKCCLFYHHQHLKKMTALDTVFVSKFKREYGNASFVYAHIGHLHHLKLLETNLMIIEQHRTLAAKDAYSSRGGFGSGRDSKVITYHKDFGEVSRSIISIDLIESEKEEPSIDFSEAI